MLLTFQGLRFLAEIKNLKLGMPLSQEICEMLHFVAQREHIEIIIRLDLQLQNLAVDLYVIESDHKVLWWDLKAEYVLAVAINVVRLVEYDYGVLKI